MEYIVIAGDEIHRSKDLTTFLVDINRSAYSNVDEILAVVFKGNKKNRGGAVFFSTYDINVNRREETVCGIVRDFFKRAYKKKVSIKSRENNISITFLEGDGTVMIGYNPIHPNNVILDTSEASQDIIHIFS